MLTEYKNLVDYEFDNNPLISSVVPDLFNKAKSLLRVF